MVYKFRLVSDEVDNFRREIDIDADATFLTLRNAICESVNYDKNQMNSFFLCEDGWEKDKEITLEDMGSDSSEDVYLMDECILSDFIEDEGQRMIFTFDYMTDRSFFIELKPCREHNKSRRVRGQDRFQSRIGNGYRRGLLWFRRVQCR